MADRTRPIVPIDGDRFSTSCGGSDVCSSFPPMTIEPSPSAVAGGSLGGSLLAGRLGPSSHAVVVGIIGVERRVGALPPSLPSPLSADLDLGGVSALGVEVPSFLSADLDLGGVSTL